MMDPDARLYVDLFMSRSLLLMPALLAACATLPPSARPVTGEWGGTHVRLSLTPNGGALEYDCAAGTVVGPLVLHPDGKFTAEGTHTPGRGGPEIEGQPPPSYRVRYSGYVQRNTMSFQGRVENGVLLGPFTLHLGAEPTIFRCLLSARLKRTWNVRNGAKADLAGAAPLSPAPRRPVAPTAP